MLRSPADFNTSGIPVGYLTTFRTYGTWLHGDRRGATDRFHNVYGTPKLPPGPYRRQYEQRLMKQPPVSLDRRRRAAVERSLHETCNKRKWTLWTFSVRTNHVHSVVTAHCDSEIVLNALKANATRMMREAGCWKSELTPWAYRGSKKKLWTERDLDEAIVYVKYEQGLPLP